MFDAIFSAALKPRAAASDAFRFFLVELALQHIQSQSGIALSRDMRTPNIASKGKLARRTALVPRVLFGANVPPSGM